MERMTYYFPQCAGDCGTNDELSSCAQIALEFVLDGGKNVFIRMADWHGNVEDGYLASCMCRKRDGSIFLLAAVPKYIFEQEHDKKGTVPTKSFDEVEMVLSRHVQAIAERVYCYGMTYAASQEIMTEDRSRLFGYGKGSRSFHGPKMERYCVPKDIEVLDCLTEDHLRRIRYFDGNDW